MQKETLRIDIRVDGANAAVADTKRVEGGIFALSGSVAKVGETFNRFRGILLGLAAGGMVAFTQSAIGAADELSKLKTRIGGTVEGLSQMQFAAERSNVSFDAMTTALQRQTRRVSEATKGTGEAVKAFQELGLSASKLSQLAPDKQFEVLAEALSGVANSGDRVRLAMKFWDTEGVQMLQIANGGAAAVRALREESDALGRTISTETAQAAAELNDKLRNLQGTIEGVTNAILGNLIPWLNETITAFANAGARIARATKELFGFQKAIEEMSVTQVTAEMDQLSQEMARVQNWIEDFQKTHRGWTEEMKKPFLDKATEALMKLSDQYKEAGQRQTDLVTNTEDVNVALDDYKGITESASSATNKLGKETKTTANELQKLLDTLLPAEKATRDFEESLALLDEAFFSGAISAERYESAIAALTTGVPKAAASAAKGASKEIRTEFDRTSDWMAQSLTDAIMRGFENGKGFVANFVETLKNWFSTLVLRPVIQATVGGAFGAIGMGAPGSAGASGMDMMGGLSNIGGMFGGGTSTSGMLNSGAVALGYNPAGAAGPTALFGGSGMGYGLAGLGGGLIGTYVGNGSTASQMGGSVGGMVGYGLGAGAAFAGTQLGMQLGAFAGPIGMVVGALIGTLIGSLISGSQGDKSPDLQAFSTDLGAGSSNIKTTKSGGVNLRDYITESAFGNFGIRTKHDAFESPEQAAEFAQVFDFAGRIENALSEMVGPETTEKIAAGIGDMMGEGIKKLAEEPGEWEKGLQEFLSGRFDIAFEIIGGNMQKVYQSIGDGALAAAGATVDLFTALDALANVQKIYTDTVEAQSRTLYENQQMHAQGLRELIAEYQGGLDATNQLSMALTEQAQLQIQLLAQIDAAKASIDANLGGTIENLTLRLLGSDEERYNYLRGQARDLAGSLSSLNDPAEIARIVAEINALSQQGIGLLSEEQLMGGMGQDFIDFLTSAQAVANAQLEETRSNIISQGQILQHQTDAAMSQLQAAQIQQNAANTMAAAANQAAQIQQNAANTMAAAANQFAQAASSSGSARPSSPSLRLRPL